MGLLQNVHKFVRNELLATRAAQFLSFTTEDHVGTDGVRSGA